MSLYQGFNASLLPVVDSWPPGIIVLGGNEKKPVISSFILTSAGFGAGASGLSDGDGKPLLKGHRSWNLITFSVTADQHMTASSAGTYDLYSDPASASRMNRDIASLADGTYLCVFTHDEPSSNRERITDVMVSLGATRRLLNSLSFRGAYVMTGQKGGDITEYTASPPGAVKRIKIEFQDGVLAGTENAK